MRNILFYILKNGDKDFNELPFNEIDSLILCQITYLNLEKFISDSFIEMDKVLNEENIDPLVKKTVNSRKNRTLIKRLMVSKRFNQFKLGYVENHLCYEEIKQYFSITFMTDSFMYIAFRGTDLTLCGWNEDFNMAFLKEIPAQKEAVIYVDKMHELYKMPLYIGGHSKGGNLAVYSALYSKIDINKYIVNVYNFDGPGFNQNIYENEEYILLKDKIINMTAEEAIVGVLLYYSNNQTYIKSFGVSVFQHDPYNWLIGKEIDKFKRIKRNNIQSRWFAGACRNFLEESTYEERKDFIDIIFYLLYDDKKTTIDDIKKNPIKYISDFRGRRKKLEHHQTKFTQMMFNRFLASFYKVLRDKIKNK